MHEPTIDNRDQVAQALSLLGAAYRGDWSNFDGRTLRGQLDHLAGALESDVTEFDLEGWAAHASICTVNRGWAEHCPEADGFECRHTIAWFERERGESDG